MRKILTILVIGCFLVGCDKLKTSTSSAEPTTQPTTAPASPVDDGAVMATVNGKPIYMRALNEYLVKSYGLAIAQQLITEELVRQAAEKENITITEADVDAEGERIVNTALAQIPPEQRHRALQQLLKQRGLDENQWRMLMRRNALLRKLAEPRVTISDEELKQAFAARYDGKVVVRLIEVPNLTSAQNIMKQLNDGADFATLAMKYSIHPTGRQGGLLPPIGREGSFPGLTEAIRQAALSLKKVGELSNLIQGENSFQILKLEKIIPPQNVKFENVKDSLTADLREQKTRFMQQQILLELFQNAEIDFINPTLKAQAKERRP